MKLPNRTDCVHACVCKYDDAMCPTDCGHFLEGIVTEIKKLNITEKDIVAITFKEDISREGYIRIRNQLKAFLEENNLKNRIIITVDGVEISL